MSNHFKPSNPDFIERVTNSFNAQKMMHTIGAELAGIEAGCVTIEMPFNASLSQQHGFLHAGAITTCLDTAAGYAAFSLMPVDAEVLTIEFKTSLMLPAKGNLFRFTGIVKKAGRTVTFCEAEAVVVGDDGAIKTIATMTATMMTIQGRSDVKQQA